MTMRPIITKSYPWGHERPVRVHECELCGGVLNAIDVAIGPRCGPCVRKYQS
jgi:hypothetical protein